MRPISILKAAVLDGLEIIFLAIIAVNCMHWVEKSMNRISWEAKRRKLCY